MLPKVTAISHEWESTGGILDAHSQMTGNSFTNWSRLTPRHAAFLQEMLQCPAHVIANVRTKQDYVLVDKNGKLVPEKVGLKGITREGLDYEFTLVFDLDIKHNATTSKDRTSLFIDKPGFKISTATGKEILEWCNSGSEITPKEITDRIQDCKSVKELLNLYNMYPAFKEDLKHEYELQKKRLLANKEVKTQLLNQKINTNGHDSK